MILRLLIAMSVFVPLLAMVPTHTADAAAPANTYFNRTWSYTDAPVANGQAARTWMWGPEAFTGQFLELYAEAPNGQRTVQYFDKSRMEINHDPSVSQDSIWYVTNGLLVQELITGRLQNGDNSFLSFGSAHVNVAGDADDTSGPTYSVLQAVLNVPPHATDQPITQRIGRNGGVTTDASPSAYAIYPTEYVGATNHSIAQPFWDFMTSWGVILSDVQFANGPLFENPFFATGYPITEAYWATIKVAGIYTDVLLQCFERRCLTYTPSNADGWQVEAGNVGQHYYDWKYGTGTIPPTPPSDNDYPSTPPPPEIERLPAVVATQEWLYPDGAILAALSELAGKPVSSNGFGVELLLANSTAIAGLYNLETAAIGHWNWDTTGFYEWLKDYLVTWYPDLGDNGGYTRASRSYIYNQVLATIYEPDSNIGRRMRELEAQVERQDPGAGPSVYWWYLLNPARWVVQMDVMPYLADTVREQFESEFVALDTEYRASPSGAQNFGDFMASKRYVPDMMVN